MVSYPQAQVGARFEPWACPIPAAAGCGDNRVGGLHGVTVVDGRGVQTVFQVDDAAGGVCNVPASSTITVARTAKSEQ